MFHYPRTLIPHLPAGRMDSLITANFLPWKGDYHHDLNTQLSYWPTYTGNHLTEGMGYLNTLWNQRDAYKRYTRLLFRYRRDEYTGGLHPDRRTHGRMDTILHVANRSCMAGTTLLSAMEIFGRPHFPQRACLSIHQGCGNLSGANFRS